VAMPRVVATFEREERSLNRRHFEDHVIDIVRRLQQSQSPPALSQAGFIP
jgi:hypothetical protein